MLHSNQGHYNLAQTPATKTKMGPKLALNTEETEARKNRRAEEERPRYVAKHGLERECTLARKREAGQLRYLAAVRQQRNRTVPSAGAHKYLEKHSVQDWFGLVCSCAIDSDFGRVCLRCWNATSLR